MLSLKLPCPQDQDEDQYANTGFHRSSQDEASGFPDVETARGVEDEALYSNIHLHASRQTNSVAKETADEKEEDEVHYASVQFKRAGVAQRCGSYWYWY